MKVCDYLIFLDWLQIFLIPCPFKQITSFDCPGCGFQRSLIALLTGNFIESIHFFKATIPILGLALIKILEIFKVVEKQVLFKKYLFLLVLAIVICSYLLKIFNLI